MKLNRQASEPRFDPSVPNSIPMTSHWIGSWEVAINRRPGAPEDLASRYGAASKSWSRKTRGFQLEAAYRAPLLACVEATTLAGAKPTTRVLDCGIGTGSFSPILKPDGALFICMTRRSVFGAKSSSSEQLGRSRLYVHS